jgi:hypothetical protein
MAEDRQDPYESTARWLEEAGRRRPAGPSAGPGPAAEPPPARQGSERTIFGVRREIYMFAVLAAAYLNYYFMQVMLEIDSLPRLVVFYSLGQ